MRLIAIAPLLLASGALAGVWRRQASGSVSMTSSPSSTSSSSSSGPTSSVGNSPGPGDTCSDGNACTAPYVCVFNGPVAYGTCQIPSGSSVGGTTTTSTSTTSPMTSPTGMACSYSGICPSGQYCDVPNGDTGGFCVPIPASSMVSSTSTTSTTAAPTNSAGLPVDGPCYANSDCNDPHYFCEAFGHGMSGCVPYNDCRGPNTAMQCGGGTTCANPTPSDPGASYQCLPNGSVSSTSSPMPSPTARPNGVYCQSASDCMTGSTCISFQGAYPVCASNTDCRVTAACPSTCASPYVFDNTATWTCGGTTTSSPSSSTASPSLGPSGLGASCQVSSDCAAGQYCSLPPWATPGSGFIGYCAASTSTSSTSSPAPSPTFPGCDFNVDCAQVDPTTYCVHPGRGAPGTCTKLPDCRGTVGSCPGGCCISNNTTDPYALFHCEFNTNTCAMSPGTPCTASYACPGTQFCSYPTPYSSSGTCQFKNMTSSSSSMMTTTMMTSSTTSPITTTTTTTVPGAPSNSQGGQGGAGGSGGLGGAAGPANPVPSPSPVTVTGGPAVQPGQGGNGGSGGAGATSSTDLSQVLTMLGAIQNQLNLLQSEVQAIQAKVGA